MKLVNPCRTIRTIIFMMLVLACVFPAQIPAAEQSDESANIIGDEELSDRTSSSPPAESRGLPRLKYRLLLEEHEFLAGVKFEGAVYPVRVQKIPASLRKISGRRAMLALARTRHAKYSLYIIVPPEIQPHVRSLVKSKGKLSFIYTPTGVYGGLPVVKLLEDFGAPPAQEASFKTGIARFFPVEKGSRWKINVGENVRILEYEILETGKGYAKGVKREIVPPNTESTRTSNITISYDNKKISLTEEGTDALGSPYKIIEAVLQMPLEIGSKWSVPGGSAEQAKEIVAVHDTVSVGQKEYKDVIVTREESTVAGGGSSYFGVTYNFYAADVGFIGCKIHFADSRENIKPYGEIEEWFLQRSE